MICECNNQGELIEIFAGYMHGVIVTCEDCESQEYVPMTAEQIERLKENEIHENFVANRYN